MIIQLFLMLFSFLFLLGSLASAVENLNVFNPDIGLVGEIKIKQTDTGKKMPSLGEIELNFRAPVDPFSKAIVTLAFSQEGAEIEEAYLSIADILGLRARAGRIKVAFNRINLRHAHELPLAGEVRYLVDTFGEAGLIKDGLELNVLLPLPIYSELITGWLGGPTDASFLGDDSLLSLQWNNFIDLEDAGGIGFSFSYLNGKDVNADSQQVLLGTQARWKQTISPEGSALIVETEWLWHSNQGTQLLSGWLHYLGYRFDPVWQIGAGSNYSKKPDGTATFQDGFIALEYKATEFQVYKLQIRRDHDGKNEVAGSLTWILGPHPVHEF